MLPLLLSVYGSLNENDPSAFECLLSSWWNTMTKATWGEKGLFGLYILNLSLREASQELKLGGNLELMQKPCSSDYWLSPMAFSAAFCWPRSTSSTMGSALVYSPFLEAISQLRFPLLR